MDFVEFSDELFETTFMILLAKPSKCQNSLLDQLMHPQAKVVGQKSRMAIHGE